MQSGQFVCHFAVPKNKTRAEQRYDLIIDLNYIVAGQSYTQVAANSYLLVVVL